LFSFVPYGGLAAEMPREIRFSENLFLSKGGPARRRGRIRRFYPWRDVPPLTDGRFSETPMVFLAADLHRNTK